MNVSSRAKRIAVGALAALAATLTIVALDRPDPASAHGSVTDPPSRNYGCWDRWGDDHQNPNMGQTDPMCAQAWTADPNTMWNWNGLFREGVAGNHQAAVPDGQLCSGGRTQGGRYASLDTVGAWVAATKPNNFTLTLTDGAQHGADYLLIYITRQGFDPTTQPLTWSSLELVQRTGRYGQAPQYQAQVDAGSRTGRHVVYTVWQASHLDQSYYLCSDVIFTGEPGNPPSTTPPPTPGTPECTASYTKSSEWNGGFGATVTVTAGSSNISGWTVSMTFTDGQAVTSAWNATVATNGSTVTATNVGYNGRVDARQSTTFGFNGTWNGTNTAPSVGCTAT